MVVMEASPPGDLIRLTNPEYPGRESPFKGVGRVDTSGTGFGQVALARSAMGTSRAMLNPRTSCLYTQCFTDRGIAWAGACPTADLDHRNDVDLADLMRLQAAMTGSRCRVRLIREDG